MPPLSVIPPGSLSRSLAEWNAPPGQPAAAFAAPPTPSSSRAVRSLAEWNDAHSAELNPEKPKEKHKFTYGKGCGELNTDRFEDAEKVETDNWVGGFYMEVYVDGWDVDKTITLDFHTSEIEFPKHACQNVRVVGYSETTVTLVLVQQRWICCESFGCALRGTRPERISFSCGTLGSPPPSPPPLPAPPPPPSPPKPRPPPPPSPPPPPRKIYPPSPPPPPIMRVTELGIIDNGYADGRNGGAGGGGSSSFYLSPPPPGGGGGYLGGLPGGAGGGDAPRPLYVYGGGLVLLGLIYNYLSSRNLLPWALGGGTHKGVAIPSAPLDVAQMVRAKPKKVDVKVEVLGVEEASLELSTKGLTTVAELGERLAEEMVTQLSIEDAFKLYYVDDEGDTMLVSAHTALRDLIYSEQITAKVDEYALNALPPAPPPPASKGGGGGGKKERGGGKKGGKKGGGAAPRTAPEWDG